MIAVGLPLAKSVRSPEEPQISGLPLAMQVENLQLEFLADGVQQDGQVGVGDRGVESGMKPAAPS
jgi:hypothetical protein